MTTSDETRAALNDARSIAEEVAPRLSIDALDVAARCRVDGDFFLAWAKASLELNAVLERVASPWDAETCAMVRAFDALWGAIARGEARAL